MNTSSIPVVAIDGPSASGKGVVAQVLAQRLGWHVLDSGVLYRLLAWRALDTKTPTDDVAGLLRLLASFDPRFEGGKVFWEGCDVQASLRTEAVGVAASQVAPWPEVREGLLQWQKNMRKPPGLVADGRDMGTLVFPDAPLKLFMTSEVGIRAQRRLIQLQAKGVDANLPELLADLKARDARDTKRACAPLKPAQDAIVVDTSHLSLEETHAVVWQHVQQCFGTL